mmetsp:Transcript_1609/g.4123  ORF Transcript_1609/g.4123 Transcript_1609/m.4123 type:complete len:88 (-) Transcript_1609:238-501(-)
MAPSEQADLLVRGPQEDDPVGGRRQRRRQEGAAQGAGKVRWPHGCRAGASGRRTSSSSRLFAEVGFGWPVKWAITAPLVQCWSQGFV